MEDVIVLYSDSSSDSIKEIQRPKKPSPVVIDIDFDELILNVNENGTHYLKSRPYSTEEIPEESPGDTPSHWTEDMKRFYNDDWGDEQNFSVEKIQAKMDKQPYLWQVSKRDLIAVNKKRRSYIKCWNCCQFGHNAYMCKEPLSMPRCHMCGFPGHVEKECPNSICLNCGNQMRSFVTHCKRCANESYVKCSRCSLFGHHFINCSDNWRKFHSTIGKLEIDIPKTSIHKANSELWCCNCGKKGHNQIHCTARKELHFPETSPFIASYENSFNEQATSNRVSAPHMFHIKAQKFVKRKGNSFPRDKMNNRRNGAKSWDKLLQVKKPKKKKKNKRDRNRNKSRFFETPDFIPL